VVQNMKIPVFKAFPGIDNDDEEILKPLPFFYFREGRFSMWDEEDWASLVDDIREYM